MWKLGQNKGEKNERLWGEIHKNRREISGVEEGEGGKMGKGRNGRINLMKLPVYMNDCTTVNFTFMYIRNLLIFKKAINK